ncbi:MAG: class I SAM-dependent DNA methyltransferase [Promethearchaeota archaeon]
MIDKIKNSDIEQFGIQNYPQVELNTQKIDPASLEAIMNDPIGELKLKENFLHKFYNFPKYYDKAFARNVKSDLSFFKYCFLKYSDVEVERVLEPACGPGMFLEALPEFGFYALGYDLNPNMVEYAKEKLKKSCLLNIKAEIIEGDMKNLKFDQKFDAAFICINSLGYLRKNEDIISHFKCISDSLKTGGIYIVEISCKCDDIKNEKKFDDTWYVNEENFNLELTWAINWYDIEQRIRHVDFHMIVNDNGVKIEVNESHELRLWIFDEFKDFVKFGNFEIMGIYNQNYEKVIENTPITGELGALFFVLKKLF